MPEIYKNPVDLANKNLEEEKVEKAVETGEKDEETRQKLRDFGYSDDEIGKLSADDFDIARDFFSRFNNPKPKAEEPKPSEDEPKPEEENK